MIEYDICMKNGVGGYFDRDGCDLSLRTAIESHCLPQRGDTIYLGDCGSTFMVTYVEHYVGFNNKMQYTVYVMPTDGKSYGG